MEGKRFLQYQETFKRLKTEKVNENNIFRPQKKGEKVQLLAGVDQEKFAISIISENHHTELSSTSLIQLKKVDVPNNKVALIFTLTDESLLSIFISFAIDLESVIESNNKITAVEIYNRYLYWQKMFKAESQAISEATVKGLINELYILEKYMIPKYGVTEAVKGWVGSEGIHKDFAYNDGMWYEAKAVNAGKITVKISSLEQLDSETVGLLLISEFEKTSTQNSKGIRLFDLVNKIKDSIDEDSIQMMFMEKVFSLGIGVDVFSNPNHRANMFRYLIKNMNGYKVEADFPRIRKDQLPSAIGLVSYEIIISEIEKYLIDFY